MTTIPFKQVMRIGNRVTRMERTEPLWHGTVVEVTEDSISSLFRVYWRYPVGKVADYRPGELRRLFRHGGAS